MELLYISLLSVLLTACTGSTSKQDNAHKSLAIDSIKQVSKNGNDSLILNWRKDSLGCFHIRSYQTGLSLTKKYDLTNKSIDQIINLLGEPNKVIMDGKIKVLRYYCNTCCENGKLKEECDYSWVDFTFNEPSINKCIVTSGIM